MEEVPPGFRFYPTEEELISFYLHQKLEGSKQDQLDRVIPELDIYDHNPWDLPKFAGDFCRGDPEQWFFFIPMKEKEAQGGRPCRLTDLGYWKATGSQGVVYSSGNNRVIGVKKTMVFYQGRAPAGKKTEWKMNEYRAIEGEASSSTCTAPVLRQEWSLCRVYIKSKCVRAFDRRPISGVATSEGTSQVQAHRIHGEDQATHPKLPSIIKTMNSPEQSFSSGDSASNPYRNMEIDNRNADVAVESLWDWEQLNWF